MKRFDDSKAQPNVAVWKNVQSIPDRVVRPIRLMNFARFGCKEPPPGRPAQRTEVVFLPGSPRCALSPATAMHLSGGLFFLVLPCSSAPPSGPPLPIPCSLFYPCTAAAAAVGATPDVFSIISSPNWRAFRFNALICFSFIWASYSS